MTLGTLESNNLSLILILSVMLVVISTYIFYTYLSVVLYGEPAYWLTDANSTPPLYIDTRAKSSVLL